MKSELLPEQVLDDFGRGSGDVAGVRSREGTEIWATMMASIRLGLPHGWRHFDQIQVVRGAFYLGNAQMRIGAGVAVSGKVLGSVNMPSEWAPRM